MPELPDVELYCEALAARVVGSPLLKIVLKSPFVLRTAVPPLDALQGRRVKAVTRLGKRVVFEFDGDYFLVLHLMIAGRLQWIPEGGKAPSKITLAHLAFESGTLALTEAGTRRRASLHVLHGRDALAPFDAGGLEVVPATRDAFAARMRSESHTLKYALTDPRLFSGIGNAYSDEILHRAKLSPLALSQKISEEEMTRLYAAAREVLAEWTARLREQAAGAFPAKVTAFRPDMAVHGRFGQPCPVCGAPVQRIVYAENEANYCARCQTHGVVLADRALSRLLHKSFRRTLEEG
ncbi:MAG TPA: DNA-formamidopyrimidine glycosylase family protein [Casimicrobiaceae bacterium]|nr:DNA-formamidopyrimidine glycosylase family protein [Casimicrobiaceae bacterium]